MSNTDATKNFPLVRVVKQPASPVTMIPLGEAKFLATEAQTAWEGLVVPKIRLLTGADILGGGKDSIVLLNF